LQLRENGPKAEKFERMVNQLVAEFEFSSQIVPNIREGEDQSVDLTEARPENGLWF
jgi:hypothetical protein